MTCKIEKLTSTYPYKTVNEAMAICDCDKCGGVTEEFIECDDCRKKPGSPTLCAKCLENRDRIEKSKGDKANFFIQKYSEQRAIRYAKKIDDSFFLVVLPKPKYCPEFLYKRIIKDSVRTVMMPK